MGDRQLREPNLGEMTIEKWSCYWLRECISQLILGGDMRNTQEPGLNKLSDEVVVECNMLHSWVEYRVCTEVGGAYIVTVYDWLRGWWDAELFKNIGDPDNLTRSVCNSSIFSFCGGSCNCFLFAWAPRNWVRTKIDDIGACRGEVISVASPVCIREGMEILSVLSMEEDTSVTCSCKIS